MRLTVGQKVAYPNQGICLVEGVKDRSVGQSSLSGYSLRVLSDNSTIFVPKANAESVGIRPLISAPQCAELIRRLADDFEPADCDWKVRTKQLNQKLRSGDVFETADVFKKLTLLSHIKRLSFREQTMLEKAKFLVVSEITNADRRDHNGIEAEVCRLVESACVKHRRIEEKLASAAVH